METYHGRAINLHAGNDRLPFHGAFLFHEMRVRSFWPLHGDRPIPLPISWADWIIPPGVGHGQGRGRGRGRGHSRGRGSGRGRGCSRGRGSGRGSGPGDTSGDGRYNLRSHRHDLGSSANPAPEKVFIPMNPFKNPAALQTLKDSFAKQPNWKAAVVEGTTWEGTADENTAKFCRLTGVDE